MHSYVWKHIKCVPSLSIVYSVCIHRHTHIRIPEHISMYMYTIECPARGRVPPSTPHHFQCIFPDFQPNVRSPLNTPLFKFNYSNIPVSLCVHIMHAATLVHSSKE